MTEDKKDIKKDMTEDKKDIKKDIGGNTPALSSDPENYCYNFVLNKSQKIALATYLITNLIKDNEPIKWKLRTSILSIVDSIVSLKTSLSWLHHSYDVEHTADMVSAFTSLIDLGYKVGIVSEMNTTIIKAELKKFVDSLESLSVSGKVDQMFDQDFFSVPQQTTPQISSYVKNNNVSDKGQNSVFYGIKDKSPLGSINSPVSQRPSQSIADIKDKRRKTIILELKTKQNLSINDFVKVIPDCSEKTIQRDLLELVANGVLKKIGERRWSRYSLVR